MGADDAVGLGRSALGPEPDRLGQLDDLVAGEVLHYAFPVFLVPEPQVAEVAAAVDQDRTVADRFPAGFVVEIGDRRIIGGQAVPLAQIGHLAKPDRRIADVGMIGKVDEGQPIRRQHGIEHAGKMVGEFADKQVGAFHGHIGLFLSCLERERRRPRHVPEMASNAIP